MADTEQEEGGNPQISDTAIISALKASRGLVAVAARALGCSRQTIYNRMAKSQAVEDARDEAREFTIDTAEAALFEAIQGSGCYERTDANGQATRHPQPWAVKFALECLAKDRGYVKRREVTGSQGNTLAVAVTHRLVHPDGSVEVRGDEPEDDAPEDE